MPPSPITLPDLAQVEVQLAAWAAADPALLNRLLQGVPAARALDESARAAWRTGRHDLAASRLKAALALAPNDAGLWGNLAAALNAAGGRDEETMACLEACLAIDARLPDAWLMLGSLRLAAGRLDDAEAAYTAARALAPQRPEVPLALAALRHQQRRYAEAANCLEETVRLGDGSAQVLARLGQARYLIGDFTAAATAYTAAAAQAPDDPQIRHMRGLLRLLELAEADSPDDGLAAYRQLAGAAAEDPDTVLRTAFGVLCGFGRHAAARRVGRAALARDPASATLRYLLAALEGAPVDRSSPDYVIEHFNAFAAGFDAKLVGMLGYRVPERLAALAARHAPRRLERVVDLGCGTGLAGPHLRPLAEQLVGVDLAPRMLEKAAARGIYDLLRAEEVVAYLTGREADLDLILAADLLIYLGDLAPLMAAAGRALRPGGLFAFSIETAPEPDWRLLPQGRFAHHPQYIAALCDDFQVLEAVPETLRLEANQPVAGQLYLLRRRPGASPGP